LDAKRRSVIVVAGGDAVDASVLERLPSPEAVVAVVAADSGVDHALDLGLTVSAVVGDFDSATSAAVTAAKASGARIERYPAAKDKIDLELALDTAVGLGADRIVVVGGHGGRLDLLLANVLLLASPVYAEVDVEAHLGAARVHVVRTELVVAGTPGEVLTLLPVHGPASGVVTEGVRWPLRGEQLEPGTSRGCSNELVAPVARIELAAGTLVAVLPGVMAAEQSEHGGGP
jgi:thiamine pyrophosphokinase